MVFQAFKLILVLIRFVDAKKAVNAAGNDFSLIPTMWYAGKIQSEDKEDLVRCNNMMLIGLYRKLLNRKEGSLRLNVFLLNFWNSLVLILGCYAIFTLNLMTVIKMIIQSARYLVCYHLFAILTRKVSWPDFYLVFSSDL